MKHYKKSDGSIWAFEDDGSQDYLIEEDMTPLTDAQVEELRAAQYRESPESALVRALADLRKQRAPILDALAGIGFDALATGDTVTAQAITQARSQLKDITSMPELLTASTYDEMKAVVLARYRQIAAGAPAVVQKAFIEVIAS